MGTVGRMNEGVAEGIGRLSESERHIGQQHQSLVLVISK